MGISLWQLLIILAIILLLFGTKKLRSVGSDLGGAVKGFRDSVKDEEDKQASVKAEAIEHAEEKRVIEGEVASHDKDKV